MRDDAHNSAQDEATQEMNHRVQDLKSKAKMAGSAAWDVTKSTYQELQSRAADCTRATDRFVRQQPYIALAIALGLGLLIGGMAGRAKVVQTIQD